MLRPNIERPKIPRASRWRRRGGGNSPAEDRRHSVTSTITKEEREALKTRAEAAGVSTTTLATSIIREHLSKPFDIDAWQDPGEIYRDEEETEGV